MASRCPSSLLFLIPVMAETRIAKANSDITNYQHSFKASGAFLGANRNPAVFQYIPRTSNISLIKRERKAWSHRKRSGSAEIIAAAE